ncbi:MAG: prephenate dehydratase [gamma proteobacterium symbiont of Bathyaustriella thionipta]|nr:prephenate dehydratase [gamma proteobacterium symbiont of Bathyaustriella thionipta]MCU7949239.1 prephenate dehydratase [gamma proteobacterium symbiont of Bathyaustriella thionipta]MCU7954801.1 prephenate dehydratase [gamma proteobacterium symbiont of Bathyaustriella thionipta]MCU7955819.1 prephenate dehydratase [gamma proteobacterium symbiont of Bathyaustriella thionipta]MCU7967248.1 prephenate dehydratase [gamma proteobacterium symbiont of Bathyaustriella thionipta]
MSDDLIKIRDEIDELDQQIQLLLNQRAVCAKKVADAKLSDVKEGENVIFYRPEREASVLRKVMDRNQGPIGNEEMARLFREVMSACLALEQPMKIAFLGPEGTFTQAAALKHFGHSVRTVPFSSIDEVFREVDADSCHYGVVPVENSTEGVISHTLDMLIESPLKICGEVSLRIHQYLMADNETLSSIKKIYSHQQSLAQCREWLDSSLPGIERIPVNSNAEAARLASQEKGSAAIASNAAAQIYQLNILAEKIEDEPDNTTRFIILGKQDVGSSSSARKHINEQIMVNTVDKTSIMVTSANQSGALHSLLKPIAENGLSMTRIESRPSKSGLWQYLFFIDIDGHISDPAVATALEAIKQQSSIMKILGSYPKAVL